MCCTLSQAACWKGMFCVVGWRGPAGHWHLVYHAAAGSQAWLHLYVCQLLHDTHTLIHTHALLDPGPGGSFQPNVSGFPCSGIGTCPSHQGVKCVCVHACVLPTGMGTNAWREPSKARCLALKGSFLAFKCLRLTD